MSHYHRVLRRFWIGVAILARSRLAAAGVALLPLMLIWVFLTSGCRDTTAPPSGETQELDLSSEWREEYFQYAVGNLQRLEEFGGDEMREQIVDRLNQWARTQQSPSDWKPDSLAATLPKPLAELPEVRSLAKLEFLRSDGYALQEAVWLRDVSQWARGEQLDDLARAKRLFDWVVRNVQLEPGSAIHPEKIPNRPWDTLLFGRGTAIDRAWVFVLLARQQKIDAVVLALPTKEDAAKKELKNWAVGVLDKAKLYLFDPALGLPIPAPDGVRFDEQGQLDIQPATLEQVAKDDKLLRQLDLDAERPYPVSSADLDRVVALVEASPAYLTARMALVESRLVGNQRAILTASPSKVAERVKAAVGVAEVRLWLWPYQVMLERSRLGPDAQAAIASALMPFRVGRNTQLWKGRMLHLKGSFTGPQCATYYYQEARLPNRHLAEMRDEANNAGDSKEEARLEMVHDAALRGKADATYWMGLIEAAIGNPTAAIDYLVVRTLDASPDGPWTTGAVYNVGRTLETLGQRAKAAEVYRKDSPSPDHYGNLLRARWLDPPPPKVVLPSVENEKK